MATELEASSLPVGMDISTLLLNQEEWQDQAVLGNLQDDPFLQELLSINQGVDLLASMLDTTTEVHGHPGPLEEASLDFESLLAMPTSPVGSEGYTSETSSSTHCNRLELNSPAASLASTGGGSVYTDQLGVEAHSPHSPLLAASTFRDLPQFSPVNSHDNKNSSPEFSSGWSASPSSYISTPTTNDISTNAPFSSDVRIDVESLRESTPPSPLTSSSSERKAATLLLSDEEKRLLSEEGISLPTDMPLTKAEQKHLKRVQRKIKNKVSAQDSRKRKKEYVEGLEDRVKLSTQRNQQLAKEVVKLQTENKSVTKQLRDLQELVAGLFPSSKLQAGTAGTMLMVVVLSFSLFLLPPSEDKPGYKVANGYARQTRALLFTETDQFGNVVDPKTGTIISVAGGRTPFPLPPWLDQTPAILQWMNRTKLTDTARRVFSSVSSSHWRARDEEVLGFKGEDTHG